MKECISVILGSDENAYGCASALYSLTGEKPLVLCAKPLIPTSYSSILDRRVIPELDSRSVFLKTMTALLPELKKRAKKVTVTACSDYYADLLIKEQNVLKEYISSPILSEEVYSLFKTKSDFHRLCVRYSVPHPKTETVLPYNALGVTRDREFPVVLKPSNSNSYEYLHSTIRDRRKVYICKSEAELKAALEAFVCDGYNEPAVIQEYIGGDERYYRVVNAYCDHSGRVRVIGAGMPLLEYKGAGEIGSYAAVRTVSDRALCDLCADLLESIGYVGFANFDAKISPVTGKTVLFELNPRQGRSSYFINAAGQSLMSAMYSDAVLDMPYSGRKYAENEAVWLAEPFYAVRSEMKRRGLDVDLLNGVPRVSSVTLKGDMSVPRALLLAKRSLTAFTGRL